MAKKKNIRSRRKIKKGVVVGLVLFLAWLGLGIMFFYKTLVPSINLFLLEENRSYIEENYSPSNWEAKDEAYVQYKDYVDSLIESNDSIVSFYAKQGALGKMALNIIAAAPIFITIIFILDDSDKKKTTSNKKYKVARA